MVGKQRLGLGIRHKNISVYTLFSVALAGLSLFTAAQAQSRQIPVASASSTKTGTSRCASDGSIDGYSSLQALQNDLQRHLAGHPDPKAKKKDGKVLYVLCPHTTFTFFAEQDSKGTPKIPGDAIVFTPPIITEASTSNDINHIVLQCGADGSVHEECIFEGGVVHFYITAESTNDHADKLWSISFIGITMKAAQVSSVHVETFKVGDANEVRTEVEFVDCLWERNGGDATLMITGASYTSVDKSRARLLRHSDQLRTNKSIDFPRRDFTNTNLDDKLFNYFAFFDDDNFTHQSNIPSSGVIVTLEKCIFYNNAAANGVVQMRTFKGNSHKDSSLFTLSIDSTFFIDNHVINRKSVVDIAVMEQYNGMQGDGPTVSITNSCFHNNNIPISQHSGLVYIDDRSSVKSVDKNNGSSINSDENNVNHNYCFGIYKMMESQKGMIEGHCTTFDNPTCSTPHCYDKWTHLKTDIVNANKFEMGRIFTICPKTIFELPHIPPHPLFPDSFYGYGPAEIQTSNTIIKCGFDGSLQNQCVISGGITQIHITGKPSGVKLVGLTMIGSKSGGAAIVTDSSGSANVTLDGCEFIDHDGPSVVEINNSPNILLDFEDSVSTQPLSNSMHLTIRNCGFRGNMVTNSVVSNFAGVVDIINSIFLRNDVLRDSLVTTVFGGSVSSSHSCFVDNNLNEAVSLFLLDRESLLTLNTENFGTGNIDGSGSSEICNINFYGKLCSPFTAPSCKSQLGQKLDTLPLNDKGMVEDCFPDWNSLTRAVHKSSGDAVFVICPHTVFDLSGVNDDGTDIAAITVTASGTVIQCGYSGHRSNSCVLYGGNTNTFKITGSSRGIQFKGLTFVASTGISILAAGDEDAKATFFDCEWGGHVGSAVVQIHSESDSTGSNGSTSNRTFDRMRSQVSSSAEKGRLRTHRNGKRVLKSLPDLPFEPSRKSMSLSFELCTFSDNTVMHGIVTNFAGSVSLIGTQILGSKFLGDYKNRGSVLVMYGGTVSSTQSCFVGGSGGKMGSIYIDETSKLLSSTDNFAISGLSNSGSSSCQGIYLVKPEGSSNDAQCVRYMSTSCKAAPDPSTLVESTAIPGEQRNNTTSCISSWDILYGAASAATSLSGTQPTFTICPNTNFDLNSQINSLMSPLTIRLSNAIFRCGFDESKNSKCIISGGFSHFKITGSSYNVTFVGLTMRSATGASIIAAGNENANATFVNCFWESNEGDAAILIYNENQDTPYKPEVKIKELAKPEDTSMVLSFIECTFKQNSLYNGVIVNLGGTISIDRTIFIDNVADIGAISVQYGGYLGIEESCFLSNKGILPGIVFIDLDAFFTMNRATFGAGNSVDIMACEGIFFDVSGTCIQQSFCEGICRPFTSDECSLSLYDDKPTLPPQYVENTNSEDSIINEDSSLLITNKPTTSPTVKETKTKEPPTDLSAPTQKSDRPTGKPFIKEEGTENRGNITYLVNKYGIYVGLMVGFFVFLCFLLCYCRLRKKKKKAKTSSESVPEYAEILPNDDNEGSTNWIQNSQKPSDITVDTNSTKDEDTGKKKFETVSEAENAEINMTKEKESDIEANTEIEDVLNFVSNSVTDKEDNNDGKQNVESDDNDRKISIGSRKETHKKTRTPISANKDESEKKYAETDKSEIDISIDSSQHRRRKSIHSESETDSDRGKKVTENTSSIDDVPKKSSRRKSMHSESDKDSDCGKKVTEKTSSVNNAPKKSSRLRRHKTYLPVSESDSDSGLKSYEGDKSKEKKSIDSGSRSHKRHSLESESDSRSSRKHGERKKDKKPHSRDERRRDSHHKTSSSTIDEGESCINSAISLKSDISNQNSHDEDEKPKEKKSIDSGSRSHKRHSLESASDNGSSRKYEKRKKDKNPRSRDEGRRVSRKKTSSSTIDEDGSCINSAAVFKSDIDSSRHSHSHSISGEIDSGKKLSGTESINSSRHGRSDKYRLGSGGDSDAEKKPATRDRPRKRESSASKRRNNSSSKTKIKTSRRNSQDSLSESEIFNDFSTNTNNDSFNGFESYRTDVGVVHRRRSSLFTIASNDGGDVGDSHLESAMSECRFDVKNSKHSLESNQIIDSDKEITETLRVGEQIDLLFSGKDEHVGATSSTVDKVPRSSKDIFDPFAGIDLSNILISKKYGPKNDEDDKVCTSTASISTKDNANLSKAVEKCDPSTRDENLSESNASSLENIGEKDKTMNSAAGPSKQGSTMKDIFIAEEKEISHPFALIDTSEKPSGGDTAEKIDVNSGATEKAELKSDTKVMTERKNGTDETNTSDPFADFGVIDLFS